MEIFLLKEAYFESETSVFSEKHLEGDSLGHQCFILSLGNFFKH